MIDLTRIIKILIVIIICGYTDLNAQSIIADKVKGGSVLSVPEDFKSYAKGSLIASINEGQVTLESLRVEDSDEDLAWVVYSDRDENTTFFEPSVASETKLELSFMDTLYVKAVENNWLNVVSIQAKGSRYYIEEDKGWIKAENLLLSKFSTLSVQGAPLKRMILVSAGDFDKNKNIEKLLQDKNYFSNPEPDNTSNLLPKYDRGIKAKKFEILFVLKQTDHAVLLSNSDRITSKSVKGWINKLRTTKWSHRVALEPAHGKVVRDRFYNSDTKEYHEIPVFMEKWHLERYFENAANIESDWILASIPLNPKRLMGYQMRFPVLEWTGNNAKQKNIAVIANFRPATASKGGFYDEDRERAKLRRKLDSINDLRDFVNVLIIMDGTASMSAYGPEISKSIKTIISNNRMTGNKKLRWGLAVYKDYDYIDGKMFMEPLSDTHERVLNKLKDGGIEYSSLAPVTSHATAQYHSMKKAISEAGFRPGQSNIVVLVGDAGNHKDDKKNLTKQDVIYELSKHRINLISFQVNYLSGVNKPIYKRFNRDARSYMLLSGNEILKNMTDKRAGKYTIKLVQEKNNSYSLGFTGFNDPTVKPVFGIFNHAVVGTGMKRSVFYNNLIQTFNKYMKKLDLEHNELCRKLGDCVDKGKQERCNSCNKLDKNCTCDAATKKRNFTLKIEDFCARHNLTERECLLLYKEGDVAVAGFCPIRIRGNDALKPVAFISKTYKAKIDERLGDLSSISSSNITSARNQLYSTIITLVRGLMGEDTPEEIIMEMTFNKIWDILLGVEFSDNHKFKHKKIKDLRSSNIESDDLIEFLDNFQSDADKFQEYPRPRDKRHSSWRNGDQTFYWIPFSKIPRGGE